jgi:hypothetical protein
MESIMSDAVSPEKLAKKENLLTEWRLSGCRWHSRLPNKDI